MSQRLFIRVAGIVFAVIAGMHALRVVFGWEAVIAGWQVPHAISWVAVALFGWLAVTAFRLTS